MFLPPFGRAKRFRHTQFSHWTEIPSCSAVLISSIETVCMKTFLLIYCWKKRLFCLLTIWVLLPILYYIYTHTYIHTYFSTCTDIFISSLLLLLWYCWEVLPKIWVSFTGCYASSTRTWIHTTRHTTYLAQKNTGCSMHLLCNCVPSSTHFTHTAMIQRHKAHNDQIR